MDAPDWVDELSLAWKSEHPRLDTSTLPPLVRLARLVLLGDAFQREVLAPFELTVGDYSVLAVLRRAGRPYALSPSELYGRLQRSSGGMTKILKRLEDQGFIRRSPDPDDGRGSRVQLTKPGLELQDRVFQAFLSASQDLFAKLPAARRRELDRALRTLVEAFEAWVAG